nr:GcrA family cell cycle regulator [Mesorhizobium sp.]
MARGPLTGYSEQEIALIGRWLREGLSASGIAGRLSVARNRPVSRNAIIGIVQRNKVLAAIGFERKANRSVATSRGRVPRPSKPKIEARSAPQASPAALPVTVAAPAGPSPTSPMTFLAAITASRCLFFADAPMDPAGPDMPVCGCERQTHTRKPYCEYHLRREAA